MNTDFNIAHLLEEQAQKHPGAIALIDVWQGCRRQFSFRELNESSARIARQLRANGIRRGDGALLLMPMSAELYIALIALFRIGAVAQFVDSSAGLRHIAHCCETAKPMAYIGTPKAHLLRLASPSLRRISRQFVVRGTFVRGTPLRYQGAHSDGMIESCESDAAALLSFTSGSTGQPKAILRTHGFLRTQHEILSRHLDLRAGETEFCTLPIFVLANLASGVASILPNADLRRPAHFDGAKIWSQLENTQPQRAAAPPAFWESLCEYSQGRTLPFLQTIHTGGGPVTPKLIRQLKSLAPNARIGAVYGSTEAEPVAHLNFDDLMFDEAQQTQRGAGLPAGYVVPETQLRILPDHWGRAIGPFLGTEFEQLVLTPGHIGEIVVTGRHVIQGYIDGVGNQQTKFEVAGKIWHRTGDAGYLDEQNRLWLMGRCGARVVDDQGVLYPFAVECAAQDFSFVKRAALAQHKGKRVLVVECEKASDVAKLGAALGWAQLAAIIATRKIPTDKRHNSKVDYPVLRRWLARRRIV